MGFGEILALAHSEFILSASYMWVKIWALSFLSSHLLTNAMLPATTIMDSPFGIVIQSKLLHKF